MLVEFYGFLGFSLFLWRLCFLVIVPSNLLSEDYET